MHQPVQKYLNLNINMDEGDEKGAAKRSSLRKRRTIEEVQGMEAKANRSSQPKNAAL